MGPSFSVTVRQPWVRRLYIALIHGLLPSFVFDHHDGAADTQLFLPFLSITTLSAPADDLSAGIEADNRSDGDQAQSKQDYGDVIAVHVT